MPIPENPNCPFCNPSIGASVFYENRDFLALYNIAPVLPGHSLVIPRRHHTSLLTLSTEELTAYFQTARTALIIVLQTFQAEAFDLSLQEKPEAGQTIEHLHIHIVPRLKNDLPHPGDWYPLVQRSDDNIIDSADRPALNAAEMRQVVERLRQVARQVPE